MTPKPRLLLLITRGDFGGAQRAVFELASGLKDRYEITVAAGEGGSSAGLLARAGGLGIRTIQLRHLRRAINPIEDILAVFELRHLLASERFDLVHAHSSKAGIIASLAGYSPHPTPYSLIFTAHGWVFEEPLNPLRRLIYLTMEKVAARRRTATIVLTESEKAVALRHNLGTAQTITVIPNGVSCPSDPFPRDEARRKILKIASIDPSSRIVGAVSNLFRSKGIDTLIRAAAHLAKQNPEVRFVVVGDGPERDRLTEDIRSRGLSEVVFLVGSVPDAGRLLPAFDVFALPSRKEGLPFAILDAAAAAIPVVAAAVGGIPEVLRDGTDALLVPPHDPPRLAASILRLISDPALAARLGASARDRVCSGYSLERMIAETDALYRRLLS